MSKRDLAVVVAAFLVLALALFFLFVAGFSMAVPR